MPIPDGPENFDWAKPSKEEYETRTWERAFRTIVLVIAMVLISMTSCRIASWHYEYLKTPSAEFLCKTERLKPEYCR
jgi:hypothetical protein